jgi:hypothetical protein
MQVGRVHITTLFIAYDGDRRAAEHEHFSSITRSTLQHVQVLPIADKLSTLLMICKSQRTVLWP